MRQFRTLVLTLVVKAFEEVEAEGGGVSGALGALGVVGKRMKTADQESERNLYVVAGAPLVVLGQLD